jgi:hypothetical protein
MLDPAPGLRELERSAQISMKRAHYHLAIWLLTILLVAAAVAIVFSPGYWEYQQIRWRTELTPATTLNMIGP